jgi:hypothetical protein
MSYQELKSVAKSLNISTKGKSEVLTARILEAQDANYQKTIQWIERKKTEGWYLGRAYAAYKASCKARPCGLSSVHRNAIWKLMESSFPRTPKQR